MYHILRSVKAELENQFKVHVLGMSTLKKVRRNAMVNDSKAEDAGVNF